MCKAIAALRADLRFYQIRAFQRRKARHTHACESWSWTNELADACLVLKVEFLRRLERDDGETKEFFGDSSTESDPIRPPKIQQHEGVEIGERLL